jgi:phosphinothricin acetyltransferase
MLAMGDIRSVTLNDAAAIAEIYKPYVLETAISFEIEPPSEAEMSGRIQQNLDHFPWLVWEEQNSILGYAYASQFKSRCAYSWSVESTVYIRQGFHGKGFGKKLYQNLLERLNGQGAVNVIGGIALPNTASVALHQSLGFKQVAQFKDVGFKLGRWWDVGYWQLQLQKPTEPTTLRKPVLK